MPTRTITSTQVITYQYDSANRMTKAGGVNYTWGNNGNLTNDGNAAYLYDRANRLISTTLGGVTTQFSYNGDGARLKQIVNGVVTTYTQDLAAPLPVVLQAKTGVTTTKYLYSLGTRPLAQNGGSWEYLLPDALGSVRQIADANGNVTLAKSYEPYGSVLTSTGTASSIFGYAGEQFDTTGLIYLRARYMQPTLGMFLSHDPWSGDEMRPGSMNGYSYVEGNPINYVDPGGFQQGATLDCRLNPQICETLLAEIAAGTAKVVSSITVGPYVLVGVLVVGGPIVLMMIAPPARMYPAPPPEAPAPPKTRPIIHEPPPLRVGDPGGTTGRAPAPGPQQPPKPEPNPEPWQIRDPFPIPLKCTPTPESKHKHIALGLNFSRDGSHRPLLFEFNWNLNTALNPLNIYIYTYGDWQKAGLSSVPSSIISVAFEQASARAEHIHFNLEDIDDPNRFALELGNRGKFSDLYPFTAVELYRIKTRPELCAKTTFYDTHTLIPSSQRICNN